MDKNVANNVLTISIIVPVYNVERYLSRCLDSIFSQQFSGTYEVIAVNDHSTDNSMSVLKKYSEKEERLVIIEHATNKKLSCARASGMAVAQGRYIMHVDSDDWLLPNALESLYGTIQINNADIVVFNYLRENNEGKQSFVNAITSNLLTENKKEVIGHFFGACWNKIVKSCLVKEMIYGKVGINSEEDLIYSAELLLKANSVYLYTGCYYVYFDNSTSITSVVKPEEYLKHQYVVLDQLSKIFLKYNPDRWFVDMVLNYFEKWIYQAIAKIHFWSKIKIDTQLKHLVKDFSKTDIMPESSLNNLQLAIDKKFFSLIQVKRQFGYKLCLGIFLRSFIKF